MNVSFAQDIRYTCKAFHQTSGVRLEKRQDIERSSTHRHQHIINLLNYLLGKTDVKKSLPAQFRFLDLDSMKINLAGKYHIILEGQDNIGMSIIAENQFVIADPYAKEYLKDAKAPGQENELAYATSSLKFNNESIVENYIEPYYFLKLMQNHPKVAQSWLATNQHNVNFVIDAWSFSRSMGLDLRSSAAKEKFLLLQDVLDMIDEILNEYDHGKSFTQIKLGFEEMACQDQNIDMFKDKQICVNLHDLFWDLFPETLEARLKQKIKLENNYMGNIFIRKN